MRALQRLFETRTRTVAGLMTGTSLDGVDVVLAELAGSGRQLSINVLGSAHVAYDERLRRLLLEQSAPESSSVYHLSQLNVRLAHLYAEATAKAREAAGGAPVDLIGSHGQTVHHVPEPAACGDADVRSTLQIGDPSVLANLTGTPVVGDFRMADMALGGVGAPLVPYFDHVAFADDKETRGLLNLGGIANLTVLPAAGGPEALIAFDTGPANMLLDLIAARYFNASYDVAGHLAREGEVHEDMLADLLRDEYFMRRPPKSTGREYFGGPFLKKMVEAFGDVAQEQPADVMATAAALTVRSIQQAYNRFVCDRYPLDVLIVSGGGVRNAFVIEQLQAAFDPVPVRTADAYGIDPDVKEALCFAVLAHETINGVPTNIPAATGASRATLLGKICVPAS